MSTQPTLAPSTQERPALRSKKWFVPQFIAVEIALLKKLRLKGYIKDRGPWVFMGIFMFYLVRDMTLYVLIPYLVLTGVISCPGPAS